MCDPRAYYNAPVSRSRVSASIRTPLGLGRPRTWREPKKVRDAKKVRGLVGTIDLMESGHYLTTVVLYQTIVNTTDSVFRLLLHLLTSYYIIKSKKLLYLVPGHRHKGPLTLRTSTNQTHAKRRCVHIAHVDAR